MGRGDAITAGVDRNRELQNLYRTHPLQKQSILKRIIDQRGTLVGITKMNLAEDPFTKITDQNHINGLRFVKELAHKAGIGPATDVLDLGYRLRSEERRV